MKKRILVDATTVTSVTDGLSQYIINLIKNFPKEAFEIFELSLLVNKGIERKELQQLIDSKKFKIVETNIAPIGPRRDIGMYQFYRKNKNTFDVFHSTSNQYPLCIKNGIATIHDITFKFYFDKPWWTFKLAQRYLNLIIANSLKNAGSVISVSDATKNMLIDVYNLTANESKKIETIYEGWEHLIITETDGDSTDINNNYGRYLFYVGTTRKHKNMKKLLSAFSIAIETLPKDINLVLTGSETYLDDDDRSNINLINKNSKRVIFTGYVSKTVLNTLFKNASVFIFPSLCEGFGIPVLESFYFDKPLLCSQTTSLPEIAGNAALLFDPENPKDIAEKIIYFYTHPELTASLILKGRERLKQFSWKKAANETFQLYKRHFEKTGNN